MSEKLELPRVPPIAGGIQVNFCKVPSCFNFGIVPSPDKQQGKARSGQEVDTYAKSGQGKDTPGFKCKLCEKSFTIKSNLGIFEEYERQSAYLIPPPHVTCPESGCPNNTVPIKGNSSFYYSYGESRSGYHKYKCRSCGRYFTVGTPSRGQKKPHLNVEVLRCLVGKMPIRCIAEKIKVGPPTVYKKIDFIHQQAVAFVANRERKLLNGFEIPELRIAVDRQEYVVNWKSEHDRRNTRLMALGSADNITGYVFGMNLNFDHTLDPTGIEAEAIALGDYSVPKPFRRHARLWLGRDYEESVAKSKKRERKHAADAGEVNEELDKQDGSTKLPAMGMQIHAEYTLFGHFLFLRDLFKGAKKVTFYMDEEAGIQGACNSAFETEMRNSDCHAFVIRNNKDMTVPQRRWAIRVAKRHLDMLAAHYDPTGIGISHEDIAIMHLEDQILALRSHYKRTHFRPVDWQENWLGHPLPKMNEPEKIINYISEQIFELIPEDLSRLFYNATLGGIDRFFMQIRRKLSLLERPIGTSSNRRRIWYGYSPYNPRMVQKVLDIYRVYYNYVKLGMDKQTPAMRIGLAKGPVKMEDILYYS